MFHFGEFSPKLFFRRFREDRQSYNGREKGAHSASCVVMNPKRGVRAAHRREARTKPTIVDTD